MTALRVVEALSVCLPSSAPCPGAQTSKKLRSEGGGEGDTPPGTRQDPRGEEERRGTKTPYLPSLHGRCIALPPVTRALPSWAPTPPSAKRADARLVPPVAAPVPDFLYEASKASRSSTLSHTMKLSLHTVILILSERSYNWHFIAALGLWPATVAIEV
jgi:hypothetical protein